MNAGKIHAHTYNGLTVQTGDLLCMQDGASDILAGQFWRLLGSGARNGRQIFVFFNTYYSLFIQFFIQIKKDLNGR